MATTFDFATRAPRAGSLPMRERPALVSLFGELRDLLFAKKDAAWLEGLVAAHDGERRPVMLIPGFLASDRSMRALRRVLHGANYNTFGWRQGRNFGVTPETLPRLEARLGEIHRATGRKVALVGWSIGGVIARELAKAAPADVERVVTLGSPFSGNPRHNRAWRLYEVIAGHKIDAPPVECDMTAKPPMPTYALWSHRDGVVAPACSRGRPGEADRAIHVDTSHIGLASHPLALAGVLKVLARP